MRPPPTHTLLLLLAFRNTAVCTLSIILMLARVRDRVSCDHFIPRRSTYVDVLFRPPVRPVAKQAYFMGEFEATMAFVSSTDHITEDEIIDFAVSYNSPIYVFFKNNLMIIPREP